MASIASCCWRPGEAIVRSGSKCPLAMDAHFSISGLTGCTIPRPLRRWAVGKAIGRAARSSVDQVPLTRWSMCAGSLATSMIGKPWAMQAGVGMMSCPISKSQRILTGTARTMVRVGRNMSPTSRPLPIPFAAALLKLRRH